MSGTKSGGLKASATNKQRHGEDFYRNIGRKGGVVKSPTKGWASATAEQRREAGRLGGLKSKRGKAK